MNLQPENSPQSDSLNKKYNQQPSIQQLDLQLHQKIHSVSSQAANFTAEVTEWDFYSAYSEFFHDTTIQSYSINQILTDNFIASRLKSSLTDKLKQHGFLIMKPNQPQNKAEFGHHYQNQIDIKISYSTSYFDVVEVFCQIHSFAKKYTVLNQKSQSQRHQNKIAGKGAFGQIFICKCSNQDDAFVVKCLKFEADTLHILKKHIKEFFICDMMSALQIGPQILRTNGFDFIVFQNCMEFEMQKCYQYKKSTLQKNIKQSLLKMHIIQMIHCDLKPENIMFSPRLNKNVILDYGVSSFTEEKWGQKSLSLFRGTYQYCSEEMKQLFFQQNISIVDLFKNDICMAEKTFQNSKEIHVIQINFDNDYSNQNEIENTDQYGLFGLKIIPNELVFSFLYFLYKNFQQAKSPIKQVQKFLKMLDSIQNQRKKISILLKVVVFASKLNNHIYEKLYSEILQYSKIYGYLKPFHLKPPYKLTELTEYLSYSIKAEQVIKPHTFQQIYFELQNYVHSSLVYKLYFNNSQGFNPSNMARNLQYVLSNKNQLSRFTQEDCFTFYLKYCSFWDPSCQITVGQKDQISQKFISNIKDNFQIEKSHYLNPKYLPEYDFVKKQCKNIVLMYGFLLDYCMKGKFNEFKENNALLILKDCIILGFQYFRFLPQYVTSYFQMMIDFRSKKLITLLVIEFIQLSALTRNHFLYTTETQSLYQDKIYEFWSHKVFKNLLQFFELSVDSDESYYQKKDSVKYLFEYILNYIMLYKSQILNRQKEYMQGVKDLIRSVEEQFLSEKITDILKMSEKALRYIANDVISKNGEDYADMVMLNLDLLQQVCVEVKKSPAFNLLPLFKLNPSGQRKDFRRNMIIFDKKINCHEISDLFCMVFKKEEAQHCFNKDEILKTVRFIAQFPGCPAFNYMIMIRMFPAYQPLLQMHQTTVEQELFMAEFCKIIPKLLQQYKRLIHIFKQDRTKLYPLMQCLLYLNNLIRLNRNIMCEQRLQLASLIEQISLPESHRKYLVLWSNIIVHLYPQNSLENLRARKRFLGLYLQAKKDTTFNNSHKSQDINFVSKLYFESVILENTHMFQQLLQFWEIRKLKFALDGEYEMSIQFKPLSEVFVRNNKHKEYVELLIIYCLQERTMLWDVYEMKNFCNIHFNMLLNQKARTEILGHLLSTIMKIKAKYQKLPPKFIIFYICTLSLDQQLSANVPQWKRLLHEAYQLHLKVLNRRTSQFADNIRETCEQYMWILSIKYLKFRFMGKRKFMIMVRRMLKSVGIKTFLFKIEKIMYFDEFKAYISRNGGNIRSSSRGMATMRLSQKLQKYTKNCQIQIQLWNQGKKKQFLKNHDIISQTNRHSDSINKLDLEMMQRYQIKDLTLFNMYDITCAYFQMRMTQNDDSAMRQINKQNINKSLNDSQRMLEKKHVGKDQECDLYIRMKYQEDLEIIDMQVRMIKQSEEYTLCEDAIELIDQILMIEKNELLKQLKKKQGFKEDDPIEWI